MLLRISPIRRRRGSLTPFLLVALVVLFGAMAVAIDFSFLSASRVELQNGTDAAAAAGADRLVSDGMLLNDPAITQKIMIHSRAVAVEYGLANTVAGQPLTLFPNEQNDAGGDIVFGTILTGSNLFVAVDASNPQGINAVRVIGRRTRGHGNPIATLASGVYGLRFVDMRTSTIALLDHDVAGFRPNTSAPLPLAPIAILSDPFGINPLSWEFSIVEGMGPPLPGSPLPTIVIQMPANGGDPNGKVLDIGSTSVSDQLQNGIGVGDLTGFGGQFVLGDNNALAVQAEGQATVNYIGLAAALSNLQAGAVQRVYPLYAGTDPITNNPILSGFVAARVVSVLPISGGGVVFTLQPTMLAVPAAVPGVSRPSGTALLTPYIVKVRLVQ